MAQADARDLAPFAVRAGESRGRRVREPPSPTRSPFQRDSDRIVHATAFRRLKDKTQVFLTGEGDHYRTRLTHTIEVSRIARALARILKVDEDLAEAIALAHDLGHPPFGHAGERALDRAMAGFGGFDHNRQTLRVVGVLERRYPGFDGLNLSFEVLEGLARHNGPAPAGESVEWFGPEPPPDPAAHAPVEAQVAALADDIAYDAHDIDDGIRAGLLTLDALEGIDALAAMLASARRAYPGIEPARLVHELVRRLITHLIEDAAAETGRRLAELRPRSADDIRCAGRQTVALSAGAARLDAAIKALLTAEVYRHPKVMAAMDEGGALVARLFARYLAEPGILPAEWRMPAGADAAGRAARIADFLAGQTDRYAMAEGARLFDAPMKSR